MVSSPVAGHMSMNKHGEYTVDRPPHCIMDGFASCTRTTFGTLTALQFRFVRAVCSPNLGVLHNEA